MAATMQAQRLIDAVKATGVLKRREYCVTTVTKRYGPGGRCREYGHAYLTIFASAQKAQELAQRLEAEHPEVKVAWEIFGVKLDWPHITSG